MDKDREKVLREGIQEGFYPPGDTQMIAEFFCLTVDMWLDPCINQHTTPEQFERKMDIIQKTFELHGYPIVTSKMREAVKLFFLAQGFGGSVRADRLLDAAGALAAGNETVRALRGQLAAARSAFIGPHYARIVAELGFQSGDEAFTEAMDALLKAASDVYGEDYYVTGFPMSTYDIGAAFRSDLLKVNLITLLAILLIVLISFRSFGLPLVLVFVIEGAIWITMGFSFLIGEPIFFISYLICLSIQMGATIDYGILLCDQYRSLRRRGLAPGDALAEGMRTALPTILTSGTILAVAGYVIGKRCSIFYISSIGLLVSRGALVSVLLMLTLLPALLLLCDRFVIRKKRPAARR